MMFCAFSSLHFPPHYQVMAYNGRPYGRPYLPSRARKSFTSGFFPTFSCVQDFFKVDLLFLLCGTFTILMYLGFPSYWSAKGTKTWIAMKRFFLERTRSLIDLALFPSYQYYPQHSFSSGNFQPFPIFFSSIRFSVAVACSCLFCILLMFSPSCPFVPYIITFPLRSFVCLHYSVMIKDDLQTPAVSSVCCSPPGCSAKPLSAPISCSCAVAMGPNQAPICGIGTNPPGIFQPREVDSSLATIQKSFFILIALHLVRRCHKFFMGGGLGAACSFSPPSAGPFFCMFGRGAKESCQGVRGCQNS